jgi:hypothetical protein
MKDIKSPIVEEFKQIIVGKTIPAFGIDSVGYWGSSNKIINYKVLNIECRYQDDNFYSINLILEGYNEAKTGMIYTDPRFRDKLKKIFKGTKFEVEYSEQGLQPDNKVNLDVSVKEE